MESFNIPLNPQHLDKLFLANVDMSLFLNNLFGPSSANYNRLALELQREFRQGGSPDVIRMAFNRINYNATTGKGSFRIVLDVRFTFGCEDSVTEKKDQTSEWTFTVSDTNKIITFYNSPFAEGRSTADEF